MQIINKKPQLDDVIEAHIRANGREFEQKDRCNDAFNIYSCFRKFETANFETQNLEAKYLNSFNISTQYWFTNHHWLDSRTGFYPLVRIGWNRAQ